MGKTKNLAVILQEKLVELHKRVVAIRKIAKTLKTQDNNEEIPQRYESARKRIFVYLYHC